MIFCASRHSTGRTPPVHTSASHVHRSNTPLTTAFQSARTPAGCSQKDDLRVVMGEGVIVAVQGHQGVQPFICGRFSRKDHERLLSVATLVGHKPGQARPTSTFSPRVIGSVARRLCTSLPNAEAKLAGVATIHLCHSGPFHSQRGATS